MRNRKFEFNAVKSQTCPHCRTSFMYNFYRCPLCGKINELPKPIIESPKILVKRKTTKNLGKNKKLIKRCKHARIKKRN